MKPFGGNEISNIIFSNIFLIGILTSLLSNLYLNNKFNLIDFSSRKGIFELMHITLGI